MQTLEITVTGKVHGVFYRDFVENNANEIGVTGWVKNNKDGSVGITAQGSSEELEALISKCYQGSPASIVDNVVKEEIKAEEVFDDFKIR